MPATLEIDDMITVGVLADRLMIPVSRLIGELMKNGVMVTVNEQLDFDTAQIIVEELGLDLTLKRRAQTAKAISHRLRPVATTQTQFRPPIVAVMGHVDHGKTSLLDSIRGTNKVASEAGGITQHISAYQVKHNDRSITFLDTPGHEAFAAIREHGAHLTDIVVIVVAADDGVKPQTVEAIRFARKAGAKIVVAINKIDREGADVTRVKQQLSEQNLLAEEWGGDTVIAEVSAKTRQGISNLLDMILLVADLEELRADFEGKANGLIIEAHIEQGRGYVAHGLIMTGTLHPGDFLVAGSAYAKVRNLEDVDGEAIVSAKPSMPVLMTGFKSLPEFGDEFTVVENEKQARSIVERQLIAKNIATNRGVTSAELLRIMKRNKETTELNLIVKADAQGSLTSVIDSLKTLDTQEVAVRIVGSGIGAMSENDIYKAQASNAMVYGFNVTIPSGVKQIASRCSVTVRLFNIIYELIEDVQAELSNLLSPEIVETELGRLIIRGIFKTTKTEVICGGQLTKGRLTLPALANAMRESKKLAEVEVTNLKRGPVDTKEVLEGEMCGVSLKTTGRLELQEGDRLEFFRREVIARHL